MPEQSAHDAHDSHPQTPEPHVAEKVCARCHQEKPAAAFNRCKTGRGGLHNHCRECQRDVKRRWYEAHIDSERAKAVAYGKTGRAREQRKRAYDQNRGRLLEKNRGRRRADGARAKANTARNRKYHQDESFRAAVNMRKKLRLLLIGVLRPQQAIGLVGATLKQLRRHLEEQFAPGMSWGNYGYRGWHIDHIKPCGLFDLRDAEQRQLCFHWSNLRPTWWTENIGRGRWYVEAVRRGAPEGQEPECPCPALAEILAATASQVAKEEMLSRIEVRLRDVIDTPQIGLTRSILEMGRFVLHRTEVRNG